MVAGAKVHDTIVGVSSCNPLRMICSWCPPDTWAASVDAPIAATTATTARMRILGAARDIGRDPKTLRDEYAVAQSERNRPVLLAVVPDSMRRWRAPSDKHAV